MAAIPQYVINETIRRVRQTFGLTIVYQNGTWAREMVRLDGSIRRIAIPNSGPGLNLQLIRRIVEDITLNMPPPQQPTDWWRRLAYGNQGGGSGGAGGGAGGGSGGGPGGGGSSGGLGRFLSGGFGQSVSVAAIAATIRASGMAGGDAGASVARGAGSVISSAYQTGVKIGQTILDGALSPLGKTGSALSSLFGTGANALGSITSATLGKGAAGVMKAGGSLIGTAVGTAGAVGGGGLGALVGGAIGLAGGGVGAIPGALLGGTLGASIGLIFMKIAEGVAGLFSSVMESVSQTLGAVGDVVAGAFKATLDIVQDLLDSVNRLSKAAVDLSVASGMSIGQAAQTNNLLTGFGIQSGSVAGLNKNVFTQQLLSQAYGIRGAVGSEDYIRSFRAQYQRDAARGPLGLMMAQQRSQALGLESLNGLAAMPDKYFNRQLERSQTVQTSLGMTPEQMQESAYNMQSLMASVAQFVDLLKAKIGAELLPFLTSALDSAIGWVSAHAGDISTAIEKGVGWLVNVLPGVIVQGAQMGIAAFDALSGAVIGFMRGAADFIEGYQNGTNELTNSLGGFLQVLDYIIIGASSAGRVFKTLGAVLYDVVLGLSKLGSTFLNVLLTPIRLISQHITAPLAKRFGLDGLSDLATSLKDIRVPSIDEVTGIGFVNPLATATAPIADPHLYDTFLQGQSNRTLANAATGLRAKADDFDQSRQNTLKVANGAIDSLQGFFDGQKPILERIAKATEKTAAGVDTLNQTSQNLSREQIAERIGANLVSSWTRAALRP